MREEKFYEGGVWFSRIIKEKQWKNKYDTKYDMNRHYKIIEITKNKYEQKFLHMRDLSLPKYIAVYAKVLLVILTTYYMAFVILGSFLKNCNKI